MPLPVVAVHLARAPTSYLCRYEAAVRWYRKPKYPLGGKSLPAAGLGTRVAVTAPTRHTCG